MATPYSGNPGNYPTSAALPDDGDAPTAELFNVPYEALFDRTAYLKAATDEHELDVTALASRIGTAESDILDIETRLVPTVEVFTSSGTWTKPAGAVLVEVLCVGGGGGGAGPDFSANGGGGGGAGAVVTQSFAAALLESAHAITIGAAGTGGSSGANGVAGGNTLFALRVLARGGKGGTGTAPGDGGDAVAWKGGAGSSTSGTGTPGEGPGGIPGAGGVNNTATKAQSGIGYGAGGGGGQASAAGTGGGGGGAAGYGSVGTRLNASTSGTNGLPGYCLVTTWRTA